VTDVCGGGDEHGEDLLVGDAAEDNADDPDALVPELRP
jgi:hypothetical protein